MSISADPARAWCSRKDQFVSVEQTEGQCRDRHQCNDEACPLESEFGQGRFARALNSLAAGIGEGFSKPLGGK